jgi:hypothetical protein
MAISQDSKTRRLHIRICLFLASSQYALRLITPFPILLPLKRPKLSHVIYISETTLHYYPPLSCLLIHLQHVLRMDQLRGTSALYGFPNIITHLHQALFLKRSNGAFNIVPCPPTPTPLPVETPILSLPVSSDTTTLLKALPSTSPTLIALKSFIITLLLSKASSATLQQCKQPSIPSMNTWYRSTIKSCQHTDKERRMSDSTHRYARELIHPS